MAGKSPLALVKEKFGDKQKLVEAVEKFTTEELWVARTNKDKGLARVSNAKLLRLHRLFTEVKEKFGTRAKLIEDLLVLENRVKDQGLRQKYDAWPVPRLYDAFKSASKRSAAAKAAEGKAPGKPAAKKTAEAKPAEAPKATAKKAEKPESAKVEEKKPEAKAPKAAKAKAK